MERKTDVMGKLVDDLIGKTEEFLQPNPASRAKLESCYIEHLIPNRKHVYIRARFSI